MENITELEQNTTLLDPNEVQRLEALEATIDAGMQTFVQVGSALLEIRDTRLYRATHTAFDDYCRARWGMQRAHAYRLIDAAQVAANLSPIGVIPATESQARVLATLEPDAQREVWQQAIDTAPNGRMTAAHVQSVVDEYRGAQLDSDDESYDDGDGFNEDHIGDDNQEEEEEDPEPGRPAPHVTHNSGNNEWYTPGDYIEAARTVMGAIDLDPASSDIANQTVKATHYYTIEDDGLCQHWRGRVWMNPPYSGDLVGKFTAKLAAHVRAFDVTETIVLVNNATETAWFGELIAVAQAVVFPRARIRYLKPNGEQMATGLQGQAVIYSGPEPELFLRVFSAFGWGAIVANYREGQW
jgi:phage N-6-adenine-methyltransferase